MLSDDGFGEAGGARRLRLAPPEPFRAMVRTYCSSASSTVVSMLPSLFMSSPTDIAEP